MAIVPEVLGLYAWLLGWLLRAIMQGLEHSRKCVGLADVRRLFCELLCAVALQSLIKLGCWPEGVWRCPEDFIHAGGEVTGMLMLVRFTYSS